MSVTLDDAAVYLGIAFAVIAIPFFTIIGYQFNNGSGRSKEENNWKSFFKWLLDKGLKKVRESEKKEDK